MIPKYIGVRMFATSAKYSKPILLLMGAPGVGKGTYGKRLVNDLQMPIFSTGEYLRKLLAAKEQTDLTKKVRSIVEGGKLVDDETILQIMHKRLFEDDDPKEKGLMLDGFPRTVEQAIKLEGIATVNAAVEFYLNDDILVEKLSGRRECEKCQIPYNIATIKRDGYDMDPLMPEKDPSKCDKCGGNLIHRDDDKPNVIKERLEVYKKKTEPLTNFYQEKGVLIRFEPKRGVKDYPEIKKLVIEFLKGKF